MSYLPPEEMLRKYADLVVNFALGGGKGVKRGDVVYLQASISSLPFHSALFKALVDAGATTISQISNDTSDLTRYYFENASDTQLQTFLSGYSKALADTIDHRIAIISDWNLHELDGVDPDRLMIAQKASKPLQKWLEDKENAGKYTWTLALYGTPAMAKEAKLSEEAYWQQIIKACYLDKKDPISEWQRISKEIERVAAKLTKLKIEEVRITGRDVDLKITVGANRRWVGGSGRNIPSFEVFTSPDWRGTEGWIRFNQPLYRYGTLVEGIELFFEKGRVVKSKASKNQKVLRAMLATDLGASQLGEFSLTDRRLSRISKFMAETLFDENIGGRWGNTHVAVGRAYRETYAGDIKNTSDKEFDKLGFNHSVVHTDMISTSNRVVTATFSDGTQKIIYKDGEFVI